MPWNDALNLHPSAAEFASFEQWARAARQAEHPSPGGFLVGVRQRKVVVWNLDDARGDLQNVREATSRNPEAAAEFDGGYVRFLDSIAQSRHRDKARLIELALAPERRFGLPLTNRRIIDVAKFLEEGVPIRLGGDDAGAGESATEIASPIDSPGSSGGRRPHGPRGGPAPNSPQPATASASPCKPAPSPCYTDAWRQFERWCRNHQQSSWPASGETVASYLRDCASTCSRATLRVYRNAISHTHRKGLLPDPGRAVKIERTRPSPHQQEAVPGHLQVSFAPATAPPSIEAARAVATQRRRHGRGWETSETARRRGLADIAMYALITEARLTFRQVADLTWESVTPCSDDTARISCIAPYSAATETISISAQTLSDLQAHRDASGGGDRVFSISLTHVKRRVSLLKQMADRTRHHADHSTGMFGTKATLPPTTGTRPPAGSTSIQTSAGPVAGPANIERRVDLHAGEEPLQAGSTAR